jgi:hypothetical protein
MHMINAIYVNWNILQFGKVVGNQIMSANIIMLAPYCTSTMGSFSIFRQPFIMELGCITSIGCARSRSHDDALKASTGLSSVDRLYQITYDHQPSSFICDGLLRSPASFNCDDCCCDWLTSLLNLGESTAHAKFRAATRASPVRVSVDSREGQFACLWPGE